MQKTTKYLSEAVPGAEFTLRKLSWQTRHRAELALAETRHKQRMILQEQFDILPSEKRENEEAITAAVKDLEREAVARLDWLTGQARLLHEEVRVAYVRTMLDSYMLPGDDQADLKSTEDMLEYGPEDFAREIADACEKRWGMSAEETKNSERPTSSPAEEAGPTPTSNATSASESGSTAAETAA